MPFGSLQSPEDGEKVIFLTFFDEDPQGLQMIIDGSEALPETHLLYGSVEVKFVNVRFWDDI